MQVLLKLFSFCFCLLISPSTSLRLTVGQGQTAEPWNSMDLLCPPIGPCADPYFSDFYMKFEGMSRPEKVAFLHKWQASMPKPKWDALMYLYSNIPMLDADGELIGAFKAPGTPDFPDYDCPALIVKPNREHPYCFNVFNWKHAYCLSIWDVGFNNATYMCGKCSDYGWRAVQGEDPAFDDNIIWGTMENLPNPFGNTQFEERLAKVKAEKIHSGLIKAVTMAHDGEPDPFPFCSAKGELNGPGAEIVEKLGLFANTGNWFPSSAPNDEAYSRAMRKEWNDKWFYDPKMKVGFGGPYAGNIEDGAAKLMANMEKGANFETEVKKIVKIVEAANGGEKWAKDKIR